MKKILNEILFNAQLPDKSFKSSHSKCEVHGEALKDCSWKNISWYYHIGENFYNPIPNKVEIVLLFTV